MIGHTHEKVDQFFSVVSKALNDPAGSCILTPLGMQEFIKTVVKGGSHGYRVIHVKTCDFIHDFTAGIAPFLNVTIKNYAVTSYLYSILITK